MMLEQQKEWVRRRWGQLLDSEMFSSGKNVRSFEERFAGYLGRKYAVATSSGTAALELAYRQLTLSSVVVCPCMTWPSVKWAAARVGLSVTEWDVDDDFLLSLAAADYAEEVGASVVLVTTAGIMNEKCLRFQEKVKGVLVEDASHSHGGSFDGVLAGTIGDISVFSFYGSKVWNCGEGGIVVTDNPGWAERMRKFANAGKEVGSARVQSPGYNFRMSEMQAILAMSYVEFAGDVREELGAVVDEYHKLGIMSVQDGFDGLKPSWYKFTVRVDDADRVEEAVRGLGGKCSGRTHSSEMDNCGRLWRAPMSRELSASHVNLPTVWTKPEDARKYGQIFLEVIGR